MSRGCATLVFQQRGHGAHVEDGQLGIERRDLASDHGGRLDALRGSGDDAHRRPQQLARRKVHRRVRRCVDRRCCGRRRRRRRCGRRLVAERDLPADRVLVRPEAPRQSVAQDQAERTGIRLVILVERSASQYRNRQRREVRRRSRCASRPVLVRCPARWSRSP